MVALVLVLFETSVIKCAEETTSPEFSATLREEVIFDRSLAFCLGLLVRVLLEYR